MSSQNTHPLNVSYLVIGLVFLGIAGSWALRASGAVDSTDSRWLVPAVLLGAGVVGLVAFAAKGLGSGRRDRALDEHDDAALDGAYPSYGDEGTEQTTQLDNGLDTDTRGENR